MSVIEGYEIGAPLAEGGMGVVYRATRRRDGRAAAVKLLRPELTGNHELVQRFLTEAKAASALHDPGIVEVWDFGYTDDGLAYIAMELLEGESLAQRLERDRRLNEAAAAMIARGIAGSLVIAHGHGIVHRDLKPDNVFLVGDRPKLLDFGIAKLVDPGQAAVRYTRTGALIGTPLYMAPEQARAAGEIDARADLYSLGCILYELLVGAPPFVAAGAGEIIAMQMFAPPERPSVRLPSLTPALEAIVMRLLEKEPDARYQTAAEVEDALARVVGQLSGRLSTALPGGGAQIPEALFGGGPPPAEPPKLSLSGTLPLSLIDEAPPREPARRSAMPILAGVIMVAVLAGAAVIATHVGGGESASHAPPVAPDATVVAQPVGSVDAAAPPATPAVTPRPSRAGSAVDERPATPPPVAAAVPPSHRPHHRAGDADSGPKTTPGPTTHIQDSGPITSPDDPRYSVPGHSPIYSDLGSAAPAAKPPSPAPAPAPAPTPPPAPEPTPAPAPAPEPTP